jgi:uncharacterized membrane protein
MAILLLVLFFGGFVFGWVCLQPASGETGVTGHGASWPGATRRSVRLEQ